MDSSVVSPDQALIGILAAAMLAGIKAFTPQIQKLVPGFVWPLAVLVLARVGTALCHSVGANCTGNPLGWTVTDTTILATGFIGIVAREIAVWGRGHFSTIMAWIDSKGPQGQG